MTQEFDGRHALITGGGTGIGAAVAEKLLRRGARVSILGRRREVLQETADRLAEFGEIAPFDADVTDAGQLETAVDAARERFGPLAMLIPNAGNVEPAPLSMTERDLWDRMIAVNLTGVWQLIRLGLKDVQAAGNGRIVVVSSIAGLKGYAFTPAYCASKHANIGLVRALAKELASGDVTVNAVCPGFTDTQLGWNAVDIVCEALGRTREEAVDFITQANPQHRFIQPQEVADTVLWLCGAEASSVTGQAIPISGGEI